MEPISTGNSKVVVNRCMSLDGFIAAAGHVMDWGDGRQLGDFIGPDEFRENRGSHRCHAPRPADR